MYFGHLILIAILAIILFIAYIISKKKINVFTYTSFGVSVIFVLISLKYCYDVFVFNPTSEGWYLTRSMYFLAQNEDFLVRNSVYFGLFWGIGITLVSAIAGIIFLVHQKKSLIKRVVNH